MNNNVDNGFDASGFTYGVAFVVEEETLVEMEQGLHHIQSTTSFESFPKLLYSEVVQNKGGSNIYSSCSICLGDYKESDMLRLLPGCGHLYHLNCVNPWLRLHSTCPICRKTSDQYHNSIASNIDG
ncbi:putative chromatin regulator PHD family [Lupinus albus]|uniref:Putative chromatin regulator PHD family n=1 Tax=Lupinus albus TaxID=3870 RepID=A0A6A4R003_LUPAL|nr:putative chromatin regulator PHD family [Lupinus albus]